MSSSDRDELAGRRLNKILGRYIDLDTVDALLADTDIGKLAPRELCFVLIELKAETPTALDALVTSVCDIAASHNAFIDSIISHLVVVAFGFVERSPVSESSAFIEGTLAVLGENVRLVYASGPGHVGNLGSGRRISFTFIHPAFSKALSALGTLPFGSAREVRPDQQLPTAGKS